MTVVFSVLFKDDLLDAEAHYALWLKSAFLEAPKEDKRGLPGMRGRVMLGPMNPPEQKAESIWHQVGAFEAREAKQILEVLEKARIPFELERDDSALQRPLRTIELAFAMNPEGSKLAIFVQEEHLGAVQDVIKALFPV